MGTTDAALQRARSDGSLLMLDWLTPGLGLLAGGVIDAFTGHSANQANIAQANANREFSRNAHQIEVEDLRKAGLNPMLSFKGSGANISGGALPDVKPVTRNTGENAVSAIQAAKQGQLLNAQTEAAHSAANLNDANAAKTRTEELLLRRGLGGGKVEAEIGELGARATSHLAGAKEAEAATAKLKAELPKIAAEIRNIGAQTARTTSEDIKIQWETDLASLSYKERASVVDDVIAMIKVERQKMDLSLPGAENRAAAQSAAWRQLLARMGFTTSEQNEIIERTAASAAFMRTGK